MIAPDAMYIVHPICERRRQIDTCVCTEQAVFGCSLSGSQSGSFYQSTSYSASALNLFEAVASQVQIPNLNSISPAYWECDFY